MKKIPFFNASFLMFFCISNFFLFIITPYAYAGAWTIKKGQWNLESFNRLYKADKTFDGSGNKVAKEKNADYKDFRTELKTQYGVTDRFNVEVDIPYSWSEYSDINGTLKNDGIGDIWVKGKYNFKQEPFVASVQAGVKIPDAYDTKDQPGLGDGQWDGEIRIQIGKSFHKEGFYERFEEEVRAEESAFRREQNRIKRAKVGETLEQMEDRVLGSSGAGRYRTGDEIMGEEEEGWSIGDWRAWFRRERPWFIGAELAVRARAEDPANEVPYFIEGGMWMNKKVMVKATLDGIEGIGERGAIEKDFTKVGLAIIYALRGWGYGAVFGDAPDKSQLNLEFGVTQVVFGKNSDAATEYYGKVLYLF
ncbi:MAG: hypothetical protein JW844_04500 [Candidatus Omnitrophica bacterium]|nr:hypothetical protein [Candidatus Omnitrophota bacterium]